jgi:hypothetical protein
VRSKEKLFYVNKLIPECIELNISSEKLRKFDEAMKPSPQARPLSQEELEKITSITEDEIVLREKRRQFVTKCLEKLLSNTHNSLHRQVWEDFYSVSVDEKNKIDNIERLFEIANSIMIGIACRGQENHQICTLYPNSEKQIPISFAKYLKLLQDKQSLYYPNVYNLTILDPLVTYSRQNDGLPFYFDHHPASLAEILNEKEIISKAFENVAAAAKNTPVKPLEELLPPPVIPAERKSRRRKPINVSSKPDSQLPSNHGLWRSTSKLLDHPSKPQTPNNLRLSANLLKS